MPPQPGSPTEHWLFDRRPAAGNDGDGIVDAGETMDLAFVIRNHWGKADHVLVDAGGRAGALSSRTPTSRCSPTR